MELSLGAKTSLGKNIVLFIDSSKKHKMHVRNAVIA